MAKIYLVKCPACGQEFEVTKGILVRESGIGPIPESRLDETPFDCPFCGHTMCLEDEGFAEHVVTMMMVD